MDASRISYHYDAVSMWRYWLVIGWYNIRVFRRRSNLRFNLVPSVLSQLWETTERTLGTRLLTFFQCCPKKTWDSLEITAVNSLGSDVPLPCDTIKCSLAIKMVKISLNFTDQRINMGWKAYWTPKYVVCFSRLCFNFALTSISLSERPFSVWYYGRLPENLV